MKNEYYGLESLIRLNKDAPMFDSYLVDCANMNLEEFVTKLYNAINLQNYRLIEMGVSEFDRAVISNKHIIDTISNYFYFKGLNTKSVIDNSIANEIYILIKSIDGKLIIHPPFLPNHGVMSWNEYFWRLHQGENVKLICRCPQLQAKFINVVV